MEKPHAGNQEPHFWFQDGLQLQDPMKAVAKPGVPFFITKKNIYHHPYHSNILRTQK
jgi:hypothetical protein